jgi:hypothetical protein
MSLEAEAELAHPGQRRVASGQGKPHPARSAIARAVMMAGGAACLAIWHWHFGFIQFGGMDGGVLINGAWQQYLGRTAYRDFSTGVPPLHLMLAGDAFKLLGPSWASLTALTACFSAASFSLCVLLASWCGGEPLEAGLLALVVQAVTFMRISWWWYDEVTSVVAAMFVLSCGSLIASAAPIPSRRRLSCFALSSGLLLLSKPNTAGPLLLGGTLTLLLCLPRLRKPLLPYLAAAAGMALLFLLSGHVSPFDLMREYHRVSGRVLNPHLMMKALWSNDEWESIPSLTLFSILTVFTCWLVHSHRKLIRASRRLLALSWLALVAWGVTFLGMLSNNAYNMNELPVSLAAFWMLQEQLRSSPRRSVLVYRFLLLPVAAIFLLAFVGWIAVTRTSVVSIGEGTFAEAGKATVGLRPSSRRFFKGLWINQILADVDDEVEHFLHSANGPAALDGRIFFGPRIDFAYAEFGIVPPEGLPLWWENVPDDDPRTLRFLNDRFAYIVLLKNMGTSYLPSTIRADITKNYVATNLSRVIVWRRK